MRKLLVGIVAVLLGACEAAPVVDDLGIDEPILPIWPEEAAAGARDGAGNPGPLLSTNTTATQVWYARNRWEETDTVAARRAGLAWGANSGLTWDDKYTAWIESLPVVQSGSGYLTYDLTTPWGKRVV